MLKRDNIANLLNQQILLEELEKKEGKKIEEENNKSKILIFVEFIGLILEFIFCFFQLIFYIILLYLKKSNFLISISFETIFGMKLLKLKFIPKCNLNNFMNESL